MKFKFIYLLALSLVVSFNSCSDNLREDVAKQETENSLLKKGEFSEIDSDFQQKANQNLEKINNYFAIHSSNKSGDIEYPDYYGGAYINEAGKLVVLIKEDTDQYKKNIEDIIGNQDAVDFTVCENSYKSLISIMKSLNSYKTNPSSSQNATSKNFNLYFLDDISNNITVYLEDDSELRKSEFKKNVYNSNAIIFKKMIGKLTFNSTIYAGDKITSPKGNGSVGFRAKNIAGEEGIVTAGHVIDQYQTLSHNGSAIGICSVSILFSSIDAAFIPITDPFLNTPTNIIKGTSNYLSTLTSSPGVGTVINKVGQVSGATSGVIVSTNASGTIDGVTLIELTTATYGASGGDSGGIVYSYVSSTNTRYTVGIHTGNNVSLGISFFTKAPHILKGLKLTRY